MKERGTLSRTGPQGEELYAVDGTIHIGSRDCEVTVKDAAPRQCQIVRTAEGFLVLDLTGQKVTKVNGARGERHLLKDGDTLTVGTAEFKWSVVVEVELEPAPAAPAKPKLRVTTSHIKKIAPPTEAEVSQKRRFVLLQVGGGIAAAMVVIIILVVVFSSSSNADRSIARRDTRPARSDNITPLPGAVRDTVPVEPSATPRQDGVVIPATPEPKLVAEPAPILVEPLRPSVIPDLPSVKPALPAEPAPKALTGFALRYSVLLANLDKTLAKGWGFEAMYKELLEASSSATGAPRGTAEHLKALAASLKDAVVCKDCAGGKVGCDRCGGKGRIDLDCTVCQGQGRVRASGAVGDADVTVKCRNCEGKRIFRGVTCPACARSGKTVCANCKGQVWPSDRCPRPECNAGRLPCPTCNGKAVVMEKCPFCVNGRQRAPGAVGDADVTMKCRNCEIDGQHGTGKFRVDCKTCGKTGKVTCDHCGGPFNRQKFAENRDKDKSVETGSRAVPADGRDKDKPVEFSSRVMVSNKVYTVEKCGDCSTKGCDRCLGVGWRIRPVSDPSRVIE